MSEHQGDSARSQHPESLQSTLAKEDRTKRGKLVTSEVKEAQRRRDELLSELDGTIADLQNKHQWLDQRITRLREVREHLSYLPQLSDDKSTDVSARVEQLREAKQQLHEAHIELVKTARQEYTYGRQEEESVFSGLANRSITLRELTRIGLGLTWPLITALVLVGILISVVLIRLFNIPV